MRREKPALGNGRAFLCSFVSLPGLVYFAAAPHPGNGRLAGLIANLRRF